MKLGRLDTYIVILRKDAVTRNAFNEAEKSEREEGAAMAERVQVSGREFLAADAIQAEERVVFRTHWRGDVTTADAVLCNGKRHNIREVRPLGRNRYMELHTVTVAVP